MEHPMLIVLSFVLGYIVGSIDSIKSRFKSSSKSENYSFVDEVNREERRQREQDQPTRVKKKITIDDTKFVTDISTDDMQFKGQKQLGTITETSDDITSASSKLAQLKKSKG